MDKTGPSSPGSTHHETKKASQIAADAAAAAESSALELEKKLAIAKEAAGQARIFARLAFQAEQDGDMHVAAEYARTALNECKTAADAAAILL